MPHVASLIYVHDPMCSWCWGFRPVFDALCDAVESRDIAVERLLGGLAADSDAPMPAELQRQLQRTWQRIAQQIPGTEFNFAFWRDCSPRRSTWPACRAVIAARAQDKAAEAAMITAIQRAYYREARNPSDASTLIALAGEIGLDRDAFARELESAESHAILAAEIARARRMGVNGFPSLRLHTASGIWPVAVDYADAQHMLDTIDGLLND